MYTESAEGDGLKEGLCWAMESLNCPCKEASHEQEGDDARALPEMDSWGWEWRCWDVDRQERGRQHRGGWVARL